jgi:hypothetical protein
VERSETQGSLCRDPEPGLPARRSAPVIRLLLIGPPGLTQNCPLAAFGSFGPSIASSRPRQRGALGHGDSPAKLNASNDECVSRIRGCSRRKIAHSVGLPVCGRFRPYFSRAGLAAVDRKACGGFSGRFPMPWDTALEYTAAACAITILLTLIIAIFERFRR